MRYYYKDEKGNFFNLKSKNQKLIEITEEEYNNHINSLQICKEEFNLEQIKIKKQIEDKKTELANTDYKVLKYIDGNYTEEEYNIIKEDRNQLRLQIKELERQLEQEGK